ncbi:MAG: rod shape-determining protein RodA [Bernardetiaceae bacterium]|nr:rod shape-determining protein RodA [Bernardetiaceae bacterium]
MYQKTKIAQEIDWFTVIIFLIMVGFGAMNIYAAVYNPDASYSLSHMLLKTNGGKQLVWIAAALVIATVIVLLDMRFFSSFTWGIYGITMLLLVAVLIFGREIAGSKSWFDLGFIRFQPAELAKFAAALGVARYLSRAQVDVSRYKNLGVLIAIIGLPVFLTMLQGDTGSALVFSAFFVVFYREGMPAWIMVVGLSIIALLVTTLIMLNDLWALLFGIIFWGGVAVLAIQFIDFFKRKKEDRPKYFIFTLCLLLNASFLTMSYWLPLLEYDFEETLKVSLLSVSEAKHNLLLLVAAGGVWLVLSWGIRFLSDKKYHWTAFVGTIVIATILCVAALDYFIKDILKEYQRNRLELLVDPTKDPRGIGFQVGHSINAIGSGGLWGKGFLEGTHTKLNYVPDQSTDFIFCTVGEEHGWAGSLFVLLLFLLLFLRLIHLAERQKSRFSRVYGYCVVAILFFHFLVNIGMTVGLFPVIGIPLPFFSYGGSSLWSFTVLLFVMIKLDIHRKQEIVLAG